MNKAFFRARWRVRVAPIRHPIHHQLRVGMAVIATFLGLLMISRAASAAPAYPLKKGPTGRYLVDQNDVPFLIAGESPQAMIGNLTVEDVELFFRNRQAHGFNTVWINLLCAQYTACRPDGKTFSDLAPFTGVLDAFSSPPHYDLTMPNKTYFARVDGILRLAAKYGLLVILDPAEAGGWLDVMKANGVDKCRAYGQFLGKRYANFNNILWMHGNDYHLDQLPSADDDVVTTAVALGIRDFDTRHIHTIELNYNISGSLDDERWAPIIDLNASYTYYPTYQQVLKDYNRPNSLPTFLVEAGYEFEQDSGFISFGTARILRRQEYWSLLGGASGQMYGNKYTWQFIDGWKDQLDTPGARQMEHVTALFGPRAWYDLVPDQNHTIVTAGYGTFDWGLVGVGISDYVTAACTPNGNLVMAYVPSSRTITVDMSKLSGPATARWYDPAGGTFLNIPGSPFANAGSHDFTTPGNNTDGDDDWVLVLEALRPELATLDNFLCYTINPRLCVANAPDNAGASCLNEEACGGVTGITRFCKAKAFPKGVHVSLVDQFENKQFDVRSVTSDLCFPADTINEGVLDPNTYLQSYKIQVSLDPPQPPPVPPVTVRLTNRFRPQGDLVVVDASKPSRLLVPTAESLVGPVGLPAQNNVDRYRCYQVQVSDTTKFIPIRGVSVDDQLTTPPKVYDLRAPARLCTPVDKDGEGIKNDSANLLCYRASPEKALCVAESPRHMGRNCKTEEDCGGVTTQTNFCLPQSERAPVGNVFINNEFRPERLSVVKETTLCVPSLLSQ